MTDKLGETGYVMKRRGNALLINAKDDNGVIGAVYDMLGYALGLEFYSYDAYALVKTKDLYLFAYHAISSAHEALYRRGAGALDNFRAYRYGREQHIFHG